MRNFLKERSDYVFLRKETLNMQSLFEVMLDTEVMREMRNLQILILKFYIIFTCKKSEREANDNLLTKIINIIVIYEHHFSLSLFLIGNKKSRRHERLQWRGIK